MTKEALLLKILLGAGFTLATAVTFAAYLRPDMLLEFANLMLCGYRL